MITVFLRWLMVSFMISPLASAVITSIPELRSLSMEEAEKGQPVVLEVQILKIYSHRRAAFVHDGVHGIYFAFDSISRSQANRLKLGQRIRAQGVTHKGMFIPYVKVKSIIEREVMELPQPIPINESDFARPDLDCQWVEFEGIVTRVEPIPNRSLVDVWVQCASPKEYYCRFNAGDGTVAKAQNLIHRKVRVRAVASGRSNTHRQLIERMFQGARVEDMVPIDPSEPPMIPMDKVLGKDSPLRAVVTIRGMVMHQDGRRVFLRQDETCISAVLPRLEEVTRGAEIEVTGQVKAEAFGPVILAYKHKLLQEGGNTVPILFYPDTGLFDSSLNNQLVSFTAHLVARKDEPGGGTTLSCRTGDRTFEARLQQSQLPKGIWPGSDLQLTGIVQLGDRPIFDDPFGRAEGFRLLLRDTDDVSLIRAASWWSTKRLGVTLAIIGGISVLALVWAGTLRLKVQQQTKVISEQVEKEAALKERQRLARELHDSLQQNMSGIALQLQVAEKELDRKGPEETRRILEHAMEMLDRSRDETRASISRLRSSEAPRGSLAVMMEDDLHDQATLAGVPIHIETLGKPYSLDPDAARHVMKITREACLNALQHASPTEVMVSFHYLTNLLCVTISDNGTGFDAKADAPADHYGLVGMRERAERIGARIEITSRPGRGTTVILETDACTSVEEPKRVSA